MKVQEEMISTKRKMHKLIDEAEEQDGVLDLENVEFLLVSGARDMIKECRERDIEIVNEDERQVKPVMDYWRERV